MPRQNSQPTPTDEAAPTGPQLLASRSVAGILVHFIAIPTGVVGAGLVYLLARNEFTKRNARNALDWHLTVLGLTIVTFGLLVSYTEGTVQGVADIAVFSPPVSTGIGLLVPLLLTGWGGALVLTVGLGLIAMGKATFGSAWRYPFSLPLVERYGEFVAVDNTWPLSIGAYVVSLPVVVSGVFLGADEAAVFVVSTVGLIVVLAVLTPLTVAGLYLHGDRDRPQDAAWQPSVVAHLGVPGVVGLLGYAGSRAFTDSLYPFGDGLYVFLAALWVSAVVYLARWWTTAAE